MLCNQDESKYRMDLMFAGDFNNKTVTLMYNNIAIYTPFIAINLYMNALLRKLSGNDKSYISTIHESIEEVNYYIFKLYK